jgi:superfamily II DNA or RNA helicase
MANSINPKEEHSSIPTEIIEFKGRYRSCDGGLVSDFFEPCLRNFSMYKRVAGYFSSSALRTWSNSLQRIISEDVKIQLLISPELSEKDAEIFTNTATDEKKQKILVASADKIIEEAMEFLSDPDNGELGLRLLAWMIASGKLEIRFGIPKHTDDAGIFHEKFGIFYFPGGGSVAFDGSTNETDHGHRRNYERANIYRSWVPNDEERLSTTEEDFQNYWEGEDPLLLVEKLSEESLRLIKVRAPKKNPSKIKLDKWRHQEEAKIKFIKSRNGILEMATGTGKTRTSILILEELFYQKRIKGALIVTKGTDLLDQWYHELLSSKLVSRNNLALKRQYENNHEGQTFSNNPDKTIAIISREQLAPVLKNLPKGEDDKLIIIHDEVHGLGASGCVEKLKNTHLDFGFKLGLSATPIRKFDIEGSDFIQQEIGPVIYKFDLKEAIERGILAEFDYVKLPYQLTDEDKKRLQAVHSHQANLRKEGRPMSDKDFRTKLAHVYKTAELKPSIFEDYLKSNPKILKNSILFVEETKYGEKILPILSNYTHLYRTYYGDDDRKHLIDFAKGKINCLITCKRVSQGIDIKHLQTVVLFTAASAPLETIQRIGRCLRTDPNALDKKALIIDFIRDKSEDNKNEDADEVRSAWLADLSNTKRKE